MAKSFNHTSTNKFGFIEVVNIGLISQAWRGRCQIRLRFKPSLCMLSLSLVYAEFDPNQFNLLVYNKKSSIKSFEMLLCRLTIAIHQLVEYPYYSILAWVLSRLLARMSTSGRYHTLRRLSSQLGNGFIMSQNKFNLTGLNYLFKIFNPSTILQWVGPSSIWWL